MQSATKVTQKQHTASSGATVTALHFTGDVSSASKEAVLGSYQALDQTLHPVLLLEFQGVDYLNSSGIALVIQVLIAAARVPQKVAIAGLTPHFIKVFTMVGITKYATIYADEAAALAAL